MYIVVIVYKQMYNFLSNIVKINPLFRESDMVYSLLLHLVYILSILVSWHYYLNIILFWVWKLRYDISDVFITVKEGVKYFISEREAQLVEYLMYLRNYEATNRRNIF